MKTCIHEVIAGNVGRVYNGNDYLKARNTFFSYKRDSENLYRNVACESVVCFKNGEIFKEYTLPTKQKGDEMGTTQMTWLGAKNRRVTLCRPCACGCDQRDGDMGVGYLTGSDADGNGFTIWIEDEAVFSAMERVLDCV